MRVLKPGGALILVENMAHNPFPLLIRVFRRITGNRIRLGTYVGNKAGATKGYVTVNRMETLPSGLREGGCCFLSPVQTSEFGVVSDRRPGPVGKVSGSGSGMAGRLPAQFDPPLRRLALARALWGRIRVGDQR